MSEEQRTAADQASMPAKGKTFYKRVLPCPPAVSFSSPEGKCLFAGALHAGTMQGFFKLIEQFRTQDEPAYCGLASLAMVLNALAIDPRRAWKGPWRWFHEQMLDCCQPLSQVLQTGIVLDQAACLARCNGAKAELCRYSEFSEASFRNTVQDVCSSERQHLIVSYSRKQFHQSGDGHFSPVGGYHAEADMVLILDTARFKYPPHWVPLKGLYQAMAHVDSATGQPRGFLKIRANPRLESVMFTLKQPNRAWQDIKAFVDTQLPALLHQLPPANPISSQDLAALSASTIGSFAQTAHPIETTAQMAERQSQEYDVVVQLLLPVVRALPKDRVSQVMALRNGSPAGCCNYAAAEPVKQDAAIEATAGEVAGEAAAATAVTAAATTEATPAAAEATTEVIATAAEGTSAITAATAEAAAETTAEATAAKATAAEAACIPRAATDLFLHELHSTALFRVVRDCLGRLQQTADHALRQGSANRDRLSAADVSSETTRPSDSAESPKSSTVWHESDVTSSPCTSAAEMADGKSAQHVCQQRVEVLHSQSCLVQQQRSGAEVHQSHSSQLPLAASGPSFIQDQDCKAPPAEQTAEEATVLSDNMLTEMICMLLLLVPRTAWHHACDEVRPSILQVLDMSAYSIVASEAHYLAAQWAELPQLESLKMIGSSCSS